MAANTLNDLLQQSNHPPLAPAQSEQFAAYLALLQKWNAKTNLTAIRDEQGILSRHFLESILCASALPAGIQTLLDFGSGAGFPGIPIALMRPEIEVTLAESQNKKAAFLREAVRTLGLSTKVHSARAEELKQKFDCVTLRAVDNMPAAIPAAIQLIAPNGWLAVLTTRSEAAGIQLIANPLSQFHWPEPVPLEAGREHIILLAQRQKSQFNP